MVGISLLTLESDKAEYMERILKYEDALQECQAKAQELQVAIIHTKGALAHVNTNIETVIAQMKEEEREKASKENTNAKPQDGGTN